MERGELGTGRTERRGERKVDEPPPEVGEWRSGGREGGVRRPERDARIHHAIEGVSEAAGFPGFVVMTTKPPLYQTRQRFAFTDSDPLHTNTRKTGGRKRERERSRDRCGGGVRGMEKKELPEGNVKRGMRETVGMAVVERCTVKRERGRDGEIAEEQGYPMQNVKVRDRLGSTVGRFGDGRRGAPDLANVRACAECIVEGDRCASALTSRASAGAPGGRWHVPLVQRSRHNLAWPPMHLHGTCPMHLQSENSRHHPGQRGRR
ncbi:hypothetical protein WN55_11024 [Dufourea novaeangliae]|uniref:Uncharacterized protein n=1 Tax=Dufourea novaeangliae TaxID=178035 RepID=A0A154PCZ1_DUFNO|nr:hypothetical protein WN55_11024 [Dufourea novaeangliae]